MPVTVKRIGGWLVVVALMVGVVLATRRQATEPQSNQDAPGPATTRIMVGSRDKNWFEVEYPSHWFTCEQNDNIIIQETQPAEDGWCKQDNASFVEINRGNSFSRALSDPYYRGIITETITLGNRSLNRWMLPRESPLGDQTWYYEFDNEQLYDTRNGHSHNFGQPAPRRGPTSLIPAATYHKVTEVTTMALAIKSFGIIWRLMQV